MGKDYTPENQIVRELHVITDKNDVHDVKDILQLVYRMTSKQFLFDIQMRFVPWIPWSNTARIAQVMILRDQQAMFIKSTLHMASWEILYL
jgi:hypothetical protein